MSLDFVSTREHVLPQERCCARLLAAVISQAILDAATPLNSEELAQSKNLQFTPKQAIAFLFGEKSRFDSYCKLIGVDAEKLRRALKTMQPDVVIQGEALRFNTDPLLRRVRFFEALESRKASAQEAGAPSSPLTQSAMLAYRHETAAQRITKLTAKKSWSEYKPYYLPLY